MPAVKDSMVFFLKASLNRKCNSPIFDCTVVPVRQFPSVGRVVSLRAAGGGERPSQPETTGGRGS